MTKNIETFKSYDKAIAEFDNIVTSSILHAARFNMEEEILNKIINEKWFEKCKDLKTPWPKNKILKLLKITTDRFPAVFTVLVSNNKIKSVNKQQKVLGDFLSLGIDPVMYIKDCGVTMLGYACYSLSHKNLPIILSHCKIPDSRLNLPKSLMGIYDDKKIAGTTVLHRLVDRMNKSASGSLDKWINTCKTLIDFDKEILLCKNDIGWYPDEMADNELASFVKKERLALQASMSFDQIQENIKEIIDLKPSTTEKSPKI